MKGASRQSMPIHAMAHAPRPTVHTPSMPLVITLGLRSYSLWSRISPSITVSSEGIRLPVVWPCEDRLWVSRMGGWMDGYVQASVWQSIDQSTHLPGGRSASTFLT